LRLVESVYDPCDVSNDQRATADQLIAAAAARGIAITYADLGLQIPPDELAGVAEQAEGSVVTIPLPLPTGALSNFVVQ
jgi:hypothetical protein